MATYDRQAAEREVAPVIAAVLKKTFKPLAEAGVTVQPIFAYASRGEDGKPKGAAIKHHGYPAMATIKVNSLKDRVEGKADATMMVDGDRWPDLSEEQQTALVDHELTHLELVTELGAVVTDDAFRPKLRSRPHDFELGGFWEVVERHKQDAPESEVYRRDVHKGFTQMCFPWG